MKREGSVQGLAGSRHLTFINLQYIDNTLIFGQGNVREALIIKWVLCYYEA